MSKPLRQQSDLRTHIATIIETAASRPGEKASLAQADAIIAEFQAWPVATFLAVLAAARERSA